MGTVSSPRHNGPPQSIQGNPERLLQTRVNLFENPAKFAEQDRVVGQVTADTQSEREATARIAVSDTSIGISNRLFKVSSNRSIGLTDRLRGRAVAPAWA